MSRWDDDIDGMEAEHLEIQEILEADLPIEEEGEDEILECTCKLDDDLPCPIHDVDEYSGVE